MAVQELASPQVQTPRLRPHKSAQVFPSNGFGLCTISLAQRANWSPVEHARLDAPLVFEACTCFVLAAWRVGARSVHVKHGKGGIVRICIGFDAPTQRVLAPMAVLVQRWNELLRRCAWQFVLEA